METSAPPRDLTDSAVLPRPAYMRRGSSASGSEIIDRSRNSVHGLNCILDEFDELWKRNSGLHGRSQSDVLPATDSGSTEFDRRIFSAPQNYAYKHDPNSDCFETANEGDTMSLSGPFGAKSSSSDLILASTEPPENAVPQKKSIAFFSGDEAGEVRRKVPQVREHRGSMRSHRASIHGGSMDIDDRVSNYSPSRVPRDPPPAIPVPSVSSHSRKSVTLQDPSSSRQAIAGGQANLPRRRPSGPREQTPSAVLQSTVQAPGAAGDEEDVPEPPRQSSKRGPRRRNFRQSSIEDLLASKADYSLDAIKLPAAERQLLERFVDTLSKITLDAD